MDIHFLENVYGMDSLKEELYTVKSWFENDEILENKRVQLPKGILFYGSPGNGKTLLLREYSKSFSVPVFNLDGFLLDEDDAFDRLGEKVSAIVENIHKVYSRARQEKVALVTIDEIDNLVSSNKEVVRALKTELDGIYQGGRVLTLAAANDERLLPDSLKRRGRFDRCIEINTPTRSSLTKIFKRNLDNLGIDYSNVDLSIIIPLLGCCSGAEAKAICNDAYLRFGKTLKTEELEKSYSIIMDTLQNKDNALEWRNYITAVHEAGHILMVTKAKHFKFYRAEFDSTGGFTHFTRIDEEKETVEITEERIIIALGGYYATKLFFGRAEKGSSNDLQLAWELASNNICNNVIFNIHDYTPDINLERERWTTSEIHHSKIENKVNKYLKVLSKEVRKELMTKKKEIKKIADYFLSNGSIKQNELEMLLGDSNNGK